MKHWPLIVLALVAIASLGAGPVKLVEDAPLVSRPRPGTISGTISPAAGVIEVHACNRNNATNYTAKSFDKTTGQFAFKDLPGDATYDIGAKLSDGRVIEGIDLSALDERMIRLGELRRKQLGLAPPAEYAFSQDDADAIQKFINDLKPNDFMDRGRVLYLAGHGQRATVLVELMRTREFYDQKQGPEGPQVIWRIEMWFFEHQAGGWERVANQERVLRRERLSTAKWKKIDLEFLPRWSVYLDRDGQAKAAELTVPDKPDPSSGRVAGTELDLQTAPNLVGVPKVAQSKPAQATSQPAPAESE